MILIDADELCKRINEIYDGYMLDEGCCPIEFENMVDDMPTAYDIEKVVAELEKEKLRYFLTIANTGDKILDSVYEIVGDALDKAIEIVKAGGNVGT